MQQDLLALESPTIAAHGAVLAHDAMTRDLNGDGIRGAGARYRAAGAWTTDRVRDFAVRFGLAERDRLQVGPYLALEGGGADVQGQRGIQILTGHVLQQGAGPGVQAAFILFAEGKGEFPFQTFEQLAVGAAELDRANAFVGGRDEHSA